MAKQYVSTTINGESAEYLCETQQTMLDVLRDVVDLVPEPKQGGTVGALWAQRQKASWAQSTPVNLGGANKEFDLQLSRLGSGSDYTVFLDALGIPSTDLGFSGSYGVYHSVYDSYAWMSTFGDPGFTFHATSARLAAAMMMRMANADVLPYDYVEFARTMQKYVPAVQSALGAAGWKTLSAAPIAWLAATPPAIPRSASRKWTRTASTRKCSTIASAGEVRT